MSAPMPHPSSLGPYRWTRTMKATEPLLCPCGHNMAKSAAFIAGHDAVRCGWRPYRGSGRCGRWVYVLVEPGGIWWTCEITAQEIKAMEVGQMTAVQCKAFLLLNRPQDERRAA